MPNHFPVTDSKERFEGRTEELRQIRGARDRPESPSGSSTCQGRGALARPSSWSRCEIAPAQRDVLVTRDLVDFYRPSNQQVLACCTRLPASWASNNSRCSLLNASILGPSSRQSQIRACGARRLDRVTHAFLAGLSGLVEGGRRLVLLFDTCEEMHGVAGGSCTHCCSASHASNVRFGGTKGCPCKTLTLMPPPW